MVEQFWQLVQDKRESGMTLYSDREKAREKEYGTAAHFWVWMLFGRFIRQYAHYKVDQGRTAFVFTPLYP